MGILHFLDVGLGDCSIIKHASGRITIIDVCKARSVPALPTMNALFGVAPAPLVLGALLGGAVPSPPPSLFADAVHRALSPAPQPALTAPFSWAPLDPLGGYERRNALLPAPDCENPIAYMKARGLDHIFRYIQSHTDMDHMDGVSDLLAEFPPANFWDTDNACSKDFRGVTQYREKDWLFYKSIRDGTAQLGHKRLVLYAGAAGAYYNQRSVEGDVHDGLYVLAPTKALVDSANVRQDSNDSSYVILYRSLAGTILFCGDSHDETWAHILANHAADVAGVDLMIAPHHGRHSDRDWDFLDIVKPKLSLFGRAPSEHLAYGAWRSRGLPYITNNQAGNVIVDAGSVPMRVFVTKATFARSRNQYTWYSDLHQAWFLQTVG